MTNPKKSKRRTTTTPPLEEMETNSPLYSESEKTDINDKRRMKENDAHSNSPSQLVAAASPSRP